MKFSVPKASLDAALSVASIGLASSDDDGDITSHYLLRYKGGHMQILATNKHRLFASTTVQDAVVTDAVEGDAFTVSGARLMRFLSALDDDNIVSVDHAAGISKITAAPAAPTPIKLASLNHTDFPYWDATLAEAKVTTKVSAKRLGLALNYARHFCSERETQQAALAATECRTGTFTATDSIAITLVTMQGLGDSQMRAFTKDLPALIGFLARDVELVELVEHDRCLFVRRADNPVDDAMVGITRWPHGIPALKVNKDEQDKCWFEVAIADLDRTLKILSASSANDDLDVGVRFDGTRILFSAKSSTGSAERESQPVPCQGQENMASLAEGGFPEFFVAKKYIERVADLFRSPATPNLRFGVSWTKKNGYLRFRNTVDEIDFLTIVAWARK